MGTGRYQSSLQVIRTSGTKGANPLALIATIQWHLLHKIIMDNFIPSFRPSWTNLLVGLFVGLGLSILFSAIAALL